MIPEKTRFLIGDLIMKGIHSSGDDWQFWIEDAKELIDKLNLPPRKCSGCRETEMSFFDWHMAQGYCGVCADATIEEMREDGYGEI